MERIKQAQKGLPIWQHKGEILEVIKTNQVVIVAGDTGCGKSTQVSQPVELIFSLNRVCNCPRL